MNFEIALRLLKAGHIVRIKHWDKSLYLALNNHQICLFENGISRTWFTFHTDILSCLWEVKEAIVYYDQGYRDGHEAGWDEALARYLFALEHFSVPSLENSRSIITTLQEKKDV